MRKVRSILLSVITIFLMACSQSVPESECSKMNDLPKIFPDYSGVTVPSNIAPLNFSVNEDGIDFQAKITAKNGNSILLNSSKGIFDIPIAKWKKLLTLNKGTQIKIEILVQDKAKKWTIYNPIIITVSNDEIDNHLAYRLINVGYILWKKLGLYQRDLSSFKESPIMLNRNTSTNCMNCHSFCKNNPDVMMFHMRSDFGGTMILKNGSIKKINSKTPFTMSAGVYPSWNPDGIHIAFSVDLVNQWFHGVEKRNEVYDKASDIVIYNIESNILTTSPKVSSRNRETLPCWSPDGKYIYYCSTQPLTDSIGWEDIKYDLCRVAFDSKTDTWGDVDTILLAKDAGGSLSFPKISPNGKWLMFTRASNGYFTIYNSTSDLYIMNLETKQYFPFAFNSNDVDSYHSWSSDGKWIVFSSKRIDGLCSRPFFSHFDENGQVTKPFVLPQKNPLFYKSFKNNYNVPELVNGAIKINKSRLLKVARGEPAPILFDPKVDIDGLSGASRIEQKVLH